MASEYIYKNKKLTLVGAGEWYGNISYMKYLNKYSEYKKEYRL